MPEKPLLKFLVVSFLGLSLVSCKKENDKPNEPENQIEESSGIVVTLEWNINDGSNNVSNADLDLYLYKGTGNNKIPTAYYSDETSVAQETFTISSVESDGDYTLSVDHLNILKNGKMHFYFNGSSSNKQYTKRDVSFTTADNGKEKDMIRINKTGNKFTFIKIL